MLAWEELLVWGQELLRELDDATDEAGAVRVEKLADPADEVLDASTAPVQHPGLAASRLLKA